MSGVKLAGQVQSACRRLVNPAVRVRLRADFPPVLCMQETARILEVVQAELAKCGETLATAGEINFVCPQKDPDLFQGHSNPGKETPHYAIGALQAAMRAARIDPEQIRCNVADAICETRHFDRSSKAGAALYSLSLRQVFQVNAGRHAQNPVAFLDPAQQGRQHYFIISDWIVSQGTTVANLASYIQHNGGHVLAVMADAVIGEGGKLVPDRLKFTPDVTAGLAPEFAVQGRDEVIASLGRVLQERAAVEGLEISRADALAETETALNGYGHSLTALTHKEALALAGDLRIGALKYASLARPQRMP